MQTNQNLGKSIPVECVSKEKPQTGKQNKPMLDHLKMLEGINKLVFNDFCEEMDWKVNARKFGGKNGLFTQKEARKMARILGGVYSISHAIGCPGCGRDYWLEK